MKSKQRVPPTDTVNPIAKKAKKLDEANFEIDLKTDDESENAGLTMDQDFIEDNPIVGDSRIEAYSKLIIEEVNTSIPKKYRTNCEQK